MEINVQGGFYFKILIKLQDFVHKLVLLMDINLCYVMKYYLAARELLTLKYKSHQLLCFASKKVTIMKKKVETNKRAGWNKRAGGQVFSKLINVQTKIRPYKVDFFLKINKRACTSIRYTRVHSTNPNWFLRKEFVFSC